MIQAHDLTRRDCVLLKGNFELTCHIDTFDVDLAAVKDVHLVRFVFVGSHNEIVNIAFH